MAEFSLGERDSRLLHERVAAYVVVLVAFAVIVVVLVATNPFLFVVAALLFVGTVLYLDSSLQEFRARLVSYETLLSSATVTGAYAKCRQCQSLMPMAFRFCGSCGGRLDRSG